MTRSSTLLCFVIAVVFSVSIEAFAEAPLRVDLIGNSITAGAVSGEPGPSYAELLANLLGPRYEIVNIGCGGSSSRDWTISSGSPSCKGTDDSLPTLYEARAQPNLPAAVATILLGTIDAAGYLEPAPLTPEEYRTAIEELVGDLLLDSAGAVILISPPLNFGSSEASERILAYHDEIVEMCAENEDVACGPNLSTLLDEDDFEVGDVHPNAGGHAKIAYALTATIHDVATIQVPIPCGSCGSALCLMASGVLILRRRCAQ